MMMMMMAAERVDFGLHNGLFLFVSSFPKRIFFVSKAKQTFEEKEEEDEDDEARFLSSSLAPLFGETTTASQSAPRL